MHTREGLKIAINYFRHGSAKDRKKIIKSLKGHIMKLALNDFGCLFLAFFPLLMTQSLFQRKESPPESVVLHVEHLSRNVNEAHLKEIFGNFVEVVNVELAMDRLVNLPRGYGYIEYKKKADAEKALLYMNGGQIDGNIIRKRFTLQPRPRALKMKHVMVVPPRTQVRQKNMLCLLYFG